MSKNRALINFLFRIAGVFAASAFHGAGVVDCQGQPLGSLQQYFPGRCIHTHQDCRLVRCPGYP